MIFQRHHHPSTPSTNTLAKEASAEGPVWELFVTDRQTAGYGRQGRQWDSPPGNLAFTLLWREHGIEIKDNPKVSLVAAVAVARALQKFVPEGISIKWPNDIFVDGRKVAGVLVEQGQEGSLVIGIGINVNSTLKDFALETRGERMTLRQKIGTPLSREEVLSEVTRALVGELKRFQKGDWSGILDQCRSLSFLTAREIEFQERTEWLVGRGEGIDEDGLLLVSTSDGLRHIAAGEVRIRTKNTT